MTFEISIQGPARTKLDLVPQGYTLNGTHSFTRETFNLTGEKQILSITHTNPDEMKMLFLRIDLKAPGVYKFYQAEANLGEFHFGKIKNKRAVLNGRLHSGGGVDLPVVEPAGDVMFPVKDSIRNAAAVCPFLTLQSERSFRIRRQFHEFTRPDRKSFFRKSELFCVIINCFDLSGIDLRKERR